MDKPDQPDQLLVTRRDVIKSMGGLALGALIQPTSIFAEPSKNYLRFAVIGDFGVGDERQYNIARQMITAHKQKPFDFVMCAGDNIYPTGHPRYYDAHFERPYAKLLQDKVSFYAVLGNHDVIEGGHEECAYPHFNMGGKNYYTVKQGDGLAEFFMLDGEDFYTAPQMAWLEKAFKASVAKWKIVIIHYPLYSSGRTHGSTMPLRRLLEPLFVMYKVNVVIAGHDHIYERTFPQQGIQHFVSGAGGQIRLGDTDLRSTFRAVSYDTGCHYMQLEITNKQIAFQAINETGTQIDSGTIAPRA